MDPTCGICPELDPCSLIPADGGRRARPSHVFELHLLERDHLEMESVGVEEERRVERLAVLWKQPWRMEHLVTTSHDPVVNSVDGTAGLYEE
jgi:hypothetical protein